MAKPVRLMMVGGGPDAFIGDIHRKAAWLDNSMVLVAGVFSRDVAKNNQQSDLLHISQDRRYESWQQMLEQEAQLPSGVRAQVVAIVTPNHSHFAIAKAAMEADFHVVCDKPITTSYVQAVELEQIRQKRECLFAVTYTYLGYAMVKQAKHMVANGDLGSLRKVIVTYPQGWLSENLAEQGQKQATWRDDPSKSGPAGALGDIGTHGASLAEYISGQQISQVCTDVSTFVDGRVLDDDASVLLRFTDGLKGVLTASQICHGEANDLSIQIYGDKGGLVWRHSDSQNLYWRRQGEPEQRLIAGVDQSYLSEAALAHCRTPSGHAEGFIEAFANIYRNVALQISALEDKQTLSDIYDFPDIQLGVHGLAFIEAVLQNANGNQKWTEIPTHSFCSGEESND